MSALNLISLTRQSAFDKMVRGLASQCWQRSRGTDGGCRYRGVDNFKCAVGQLIENDESARAFDRMLDSSVAILVQKGVISMTPEVLDLVRDAQALHDSSCNPGAMIIAFTSLAKNWDLTWPSDVSQEIKS